MTICMIAACLGIIGAGDDGPRRPLPEAERTVIDADFPGAYQVELADVDGDGKGDVVALGGGTCAWYRNPSWEKRVITGPDRTPGAISSATADLDGDGRAEVAIAYEFAMNEPTKGRLAIAVQGNGLDDPWELRPVAEVGSIHRLRLGRLDGGPRPDFLAVAPIFGPSAAAPSYDQAPAALATLEIGPDGRPERLSPRVVDRRTILHAIEVIDVDGDGTTEILTADAAGVALVSYPPIDRRTFRPAWSSRPLVPGVAGRAPASGSSEVRLGRLADGRRLLATIDPWHGREVAVCVEKAAGSLDFGPRVVLDDTLDQGHALCAADVDGDGDDEVFAGHRGRDHRVSAYDYDGESWTRTVLDPGVAAQDLRAADLDGDGRPEVVAAGGSTKNVVMYRFKRP